MNNKSNHLEIASLCRSFGGLKVASDISLHIPQGSRLAVIGPNGAGKTTLVNLISGALEPSSGEIRLDGQSILALDEAARARAGIVRTFQIGRLFKDLTLLDNLRLPFIQQSGQSRRLWPSAAADATVDERAYALLERLQLRASAHRIVGTLAYGEQRLTEIAIALAANPKILLLDEPAAGVPKGESGIILDVIAALPAELSIVLIEHDMDVVFRFANRIVVMADGAVVADAEPAEIAANEHVNQIYFGRDDARRQH